MPDDQLRTDEDVEGILRLAVQQTTVDTADLRSRLSLSAEELGITEEQLKLAETQYFEEKEASRLREKIEIEEKALSAKEQKQHWIRIFSIIGVVLGTLSFMAFANSGGFHSSTLMFMIFPIIFFKRLGPRIRGPRHRYSYRGNDDRIK
ncbi:MAG: hypothetical protein ACKVQS_13280 [Fimbriimonadaceae bacterium]